MADFAVTISEDIPDQLTNHLYYGTVLGPNYTTGGNLFDVALVTRFDYVDVQLPGYVCVWVPSTQLVKVYRQKDPANAGGADIALPEVGNAVDLTGVSGVWFGIGS
jgi:hypothetical protein